MKKKGKILSVLLAAVLLCLTCSGMLMPRADAESGKWVATWSTSLVDASISLSNMALQDIIPANSTLRTEIVVTTAGTKLRFELSNKYSLTPITINEASVAQTDGQYEAKIKAGTQKPITFSGNASVTIPAGGRVVSDEIPYTTKALDKLSVSLFIRDTSYITTAGLSNGRTYLNAGGYILGKSKINNASLPNSTEISISSSTITYHTIPLLEEVDSFSPDVNAGCAVFVGDSTLVNDAYLYYAKRVISTGAQNIGIVNKAIIGNKLMSNGSGIIGKLYGEALIDRFQQDVLDVEGVRYCFVKIGLNDVLHQFSASLSPSTPKLSPDQIIAGYRTLIRMAHEKGIKIYFFTKSPWNGYKRSFLGQTDDLVWSREAQDMCDALNKWITENNEADGFIDCSPLADPSEPTRLCPSFTPDGAHLTDIGSVALADLIELEKVGLSSSAGKKAAEIANVNPYAEKEKILQNMNTTVAPVTQNPTAAPTAPATTVNPNSETAYEYIAPQTSPEPSTEPYTQPPVQTPSSQTPTYTPAGENVNYNTQEKSGAASIGNGAPIVFILILFFVIIIAAAVVILTVGKKPEEDY
ncbi:MAG: hypothetical protein IJT27_03645 [Clostridia bacterium]|nr:hypothetical protein [Clostridia bacterium]